MADSLTRRRDVLDGPPSQPKHRSAPKTGLSVLHGGKSSPPSSTPGDTSADDDDEVNSPDGMHAEADDPESELNGHPVVRAFDELQQVQNHLQNLGTIMPNVMMACQDLVMTLRQLVPQEAAAMLSGNPSGAPAGTPSGGAAPGGPQMSGLQSLAAGGVGGPGPVAPPGVPGMPGSPM